MEGERNAGQRRLPTVGRKGQRAETDDDKAKKSSQSNVQAGGARRLVGGSPTQPPNGPSHLTPSRRMASAVGPEAPGGQPGSPQQLGDAGIPLPVPPASATDPGGPARVLGLRRLKGSETRVLIQHAYAVAANANMRTEPRS